MRYIIFVVLLIAGGFILNISDIVNSYCIDYGRNDNDNTRYIICNRNDRIVAFCIYRNPKRIKYRVIVKTKYISDAGFQGLRPFVFMPSKKNMEESLEVSGIMLIFAPLKFQCGTSMPPS